MAEPRLVSNKWEIIRVIGHGGMGSVYEVRHTTLDIRRAIKTLHRHLADDPEIVRRFLREGRNEARLEHPNIVRVYDFDTDPEFGTYLTMEIVEGFDLKHHMRQGALPVHEVLRIGREIAAALDYAHCANPPVVHRDIKPANILISDKTGIAKVTDFGIAKELAERETGVTGTQGFIGTIRYAAPEQVRADVEIDARVDLYSLGVMLYEMLSGKVFLESEKPADIYRRTMVELDWQPPMVYPFPPPEELAEVIRWCLQRQRADRIPSAREIIKCLQVCTQHGEPHIVHGGGGAASVPPALAALPEAVAETSLTAATIVPLVIEEDSTTIVGLRARITRFRQDLDQEAESFVRLYAEAGDLDAPRDGVPLPSELSQRLAALDDEVDGALDSRDRERLAQLFSRSERLREEFAVGTRELRQRLAAGIAASLENLRSTWSGLTAAAGGAVSAETQASFDALLQQAQAAADATEWQPGREALQRAQALVAQTHAGLAQQIAAQVDELLQQAASVNAESVRYRDTDAPPDVDVVAVQAAAVADLDAGRADAALGRARDALEQARGAHARRRREAEALLARHRQAAEAALEGLDPRLAEGVAADDFRRATIAIESARAAERQDELNAAAARYDEAAQCLDRVRRRVAEEQTAHLEGLRAHVAELQEQAAQAPVGVMADASARAETLVQEAERAGTTTPLESARQLLESALAEVPDYLAAQAAGDAARVAEQRVREFNPTPAQNQAGRAPQATAHSAFSERRWRDAQVAYQEAERILLELAQQLGAERERAAEAATAATLLAAARAAANDARTALDVSTAGECAADALRDAEEAFAAAARTEQGGDAAHAAQQYTQAQTLYARTTELVAAEYTRRLTAAGRDLRALTEHAAADPAEVVGSARAHAERVLSGPQPEAFATAWSALREAQAALEGARAEIPAFSDAQAQQAAVETALQRVRALQPEPAALEAVDRLLQRGVTAFDRRDWTAARDVYARAAAELSALDQQLERQRRVQGAAAARAAVERVRDGLDTAAARRCATAELDSAEKEYSLGVQAQDADDFEAAVTSFEAAAHTFATVAEAVSRDYARLVADARTRLQQLLDGSAGAPEEVVGAARQRAQAVVTDAETRDSRTALTGLEEALGALQGARDQVPAFTAACEQQQRAAEAQTRAEALRPRPRRKDLRAVQALVKDATAAAQRRDWAAMRDRYAAAADAATTLAPGRPSIWPRLAAAAAVGIFAIVIAIWQWTSPRPSPKPEPTARAQPEAKLPAPPPAPQVDAPVPWRIASLDPKTDLVIGQENKPLAFSITPAGGAAGTRAKIHWQLDDKPASADTTTWTYSPDFAAAGDHTVGVRIGDGDRPDQAHTWTVRVADVNRAPKLADHKTSIDAKPGDTVVLKANATDEDGNDQLSYNWTVDGKPAGSDAPQLDLKVKASHAVGLAVSDGKDTTQTSWQVAAVAPFVFDYAPKQLETLRLGSPQEFKLIAPRDVSLADVTVTWTVDGRKVSDGPTFNLQTTDSLVRGTPVKVAATAVSKQGLSFTHDWKVNVLPPIPKIESTTPSTDKPIDAESGQALAFKVTAAPTVGNQQLAYVYSVDGQKTDARSPQFEYRVADEGKHSVTARLEDNYRQASQPVTWQLQGSDILAQARKWVGTFQEARQSGDAEKEGRLRDLSAAEVGRLKDAYSKQKDRQVSFTAPQLEKLAANQARATFTMTQSFETVDGQQLSGRLACDFTLSRVDGRLRAERSAQGPCVPVQ